MYFRSRLLLVFVGIIWATDLFAHVLGPDPGVNGLFGNAQTCNMSGCHDSFPLNGTNGSVTVSGLPTGWVAGQAYTLSVTITGPATQRLFGFQLSAVSDATNQQAGTLTAANARAKVICGLSTLAISMQEVSCTTGGAIQYAEHVNATLVTSTYSVIWTAPASASVGTVRFNVAGNAANGDNLPTNDFIYTKIYRVSAVDLSVHAFTMVDRGGISVITDGSGNLTAGYARILVDSGTTPSGVAIFGERIGGVLVTEAGVPASALIHNGRIYAEVGTAGFSGQGTDIGLAIANPSISQSATISFSYTTAAGADIPGGTYSLAPGAQLASFLDQPPWNAPLGFQGTFSFSSDVPISVVALEGFRNERNEFLITTLPVIDTSATPLTTTVVLPHFTDGAGWSTYILLVNATDTTMTGTIQFRDANGNVQSLTANGQTANSFAYSVPPRSSFKLTTAGAGSFKSGSVSVTPASGNNSPVSLAVFSFAAGGVTVTQAGVPSNAATGFRMFVEGVPGRPAATIGSYSSGFAVANASSSGATVTFNLYTLAGASTGFTKTVQLGPFGQVAQFLEDVFPTLQLPFQGILEITTSSSAISVVGLRIRYNERDEFLMTTTPPTDESSSTAPTESDFPHILNGGGFTTQFILFSGSSGQSATGKLEFHKQDGSGFNLNVN